MSTDEKTYGWVYLTDSTKNYIYGTPDGGEIAVDYIQDSPYVSAEIRTPARCIGEVTHFLRHGPNYVRRPDRDDVPTLRPRLSRTEWDEVAMFLQKYPHILVDTMRLPDPLPENCRVDSGAVAFVPGDRPTCTGPLAPGNKPRMTKIGGFISIDLPLSGVYYPCSRMPKEWEPKA